MEQSVDVDVVGVQVVCPVTRRASSLRGRERPTSGSTIWSVTARPPVGRRRGPRARCSGSRCTGRGCPPGPRVPPAARGRVLAQQIAGSHDHPGGAVAALERVPLSERLLERVPLPVVRQPWMVVTSLPSAWTARTEQLLTVSPSRSTVQAPQFDVSQPIGVPVRPRWWRERELEQEGGWTRPRRRRHRPPPNADALQKRRGVSAILRGVRHSRAGRGGRQRCGGGFVER